MRLFKISFTSAILLLVGCQSIKFNTNAGSYIINQTILESLEEYSSDQNAIEAGASLLGKVTGQYCLAENLNPAEELINNSSDSYEKNRVKVYVYEYFKAEVLALNGNACV